MSRRGHTWVRNGYGPFWRFMVEMPLYGPRGRGKMVKVDDDVNEQYGHLHWQVNKHGYPYKVFENKRGVRKQKSLHRVIMGVDDPNQRIDHISGDRLDARRENLRLCTNAENTRNSGKRAGTATSPYKGVHRLSDNLWRASIMVDYTKINLGNYADPEEAAYVYDQWALQLFGQYARTNLLW